MEVKTDTKEKFHVISVAATNLSANMTEELCTDLNNYLHQEIKNVILKLINVKEMDEESGESLVKIQQKFYESGASFVFCELFPSLETFLDDKGLLELMNITPTESEALDIIQMEEIERELLGDEEGL